MVAGEREAGGSSCSDVVGIDFHEVHIGTEVIRQGAAAVVAAVQDHHDGHRNTGPLGRNRDCRQTCRQCRGLVVSGHDNHRTSETRSSHGSEIAGSRDFFTPPGAVAGATARAGRR